MVLELIDEFIQKLICKRWYLVDNLVFFHQKCMFQYDEELKLQGPTNDLLGLVQRGLPGFQQRLSDICTLTPSGNDDLRQIRGCSYDVRCFIEFMKSIFLNKSKNQQVRTCTRK